MRNAQFRGGRDKEGPPSEIPVAGIFSKSEAIHIDVACPEIHVVIAERKAPIPCRPPEIFQRDRNPPGRGWHAVNTDTGHSHTPAARDPHTHRGPRHSRQIQTAGNRDIQKRASPFASNDEEKRCNNSRFQRTGENLLTPYDRFANHLYASGASDSGACLRC